jgi:hypothetical protein
MVEEMGETDDDDADAALMHCETAAAACSDANGADSCFSSSLTRCCGKVIHLQGA